MDDSQKVEFGTAIGAMCAAFGTEASKALLLGYWMGLSDMSLADVQRAVARSMRECQHLPRPVELRRLAGEKTSDEAAIVAWDDVLRAIPVGTYKHVDFSDRLINAVIRNLGGWPNFVGRFMDAESEKWVRIEFLKCYASFASSGVSGEMCERLAGISEKTAVGGDIREPVVVKIECSNNSRQMVITQQPEPKRIQSNV